MILRQGAGLLGGAFAELTDGGISARSRDKLLRALDPLLDRGDVGAAASEGPRVLAIRELTAKRTGSLMSVDLTVDVPHTTTVQATSELEDKIMRLLKNARREVSEVTGRITFRPIESAS